MMYTDPAADQHTFTICYLDYLLDPAELGKTAEEFCIKLFMGETIFCKVSTSIGIATVTMSYKMLQIRS